MNLNEVIERVRDDDEGKQDVKRTKDYMQMYEGRIQILDLHKFDQSGGFQPTRWAATQLCQRLNMPTAYFRRCPTTLQDAQVNHWLRQEDLRLKRERNGTPEKWLLRTKNGDLRGILSERYGRFDNIKVVSALSSVLDPRFEVGWFAMTEEAFHLRVMDPNLASDVLPGDRVMVGLHIANSEVGKRAVSIDVLVYRQVCANGLIRLVKGHSLLHRRHVAISDEHFVVSLHSAIRTALVEGISFIERMRQATTETLDDVEKVFAVLTERWNLSEKLADAVKSALLQERWGQQETLYGLVNAFTQTAQLLAPDDRYTIEMLAGDLLDRGLPKGETVLRVKTTLLSDTILTLPFEEPILAIAA